MNPQKDTSLPLQTTRVDVLHLYDCRINRVILVVFFTGHIFKKLFVTKIMYKCVVM